MDRAINEQAYVSSREAARLLGVKAATLYAYVSRGLVRSVPSGDGRGRRYLRSDLARCKSRSDAHAGHGPLAGAALRWGEPVLDSALTSIGDEGPRYRGQLATELAAQGVSFEAVAELLWAVAPSSAERPQWPKPTVAQRRRDIALTRNVRRVVEVALRVGGNF